MEASEPDVLVRFEDVEKTYDGVTNVVRALDLDICRGEFLTLLGPSGSGKTTTLMMLAGFEAPTAGEVSLAGRSLRNVPPFRRNMGIVFQNYALFPHRTVFQNIAFPLVQRRLRRDAVRERVGRFLAMVELDGLADRYPNQLSGGQQQRVALARALVFEPDLVLMDEPLGALDKKLREQMQLEIKHLHETLGMTVVYVTHDQGEALTMSDRVAVLEDGVIQQIDTPHAVYERPMNAFVANFVGESNNFLGTVERVDGATCTVALDSGAHVEALAIQVPGPGARTELSVRPERVSVGPAVEGCRNRLDARVLEIIYFGDHSRVRMEVEGSTDFMAKVPIQGDGIALAPGDALEIGWPAEVCRALDARS